MTMEIKENPQERAEQIAEMIIRGQEQANSVSIDAEDRSRLVTGLSTHIMKAAWLTDRAYHFYIENSDMLVDLMAAFLTLPRPTEIKKQN